MAKRYTVGIKDQELSYSLFEYTIEQIKNIVNENNKNDKSEYMLSEPYITKNNEIKVIKYKKLSKSHEIKSVDSYTLKYKDEKTIKEKHCITNPNEIIIMYKYKGLRILPTFYDEDRDYLSVSNTKQKMIKYSQDVNFISKIVENELIQKTIGRKSESLEKLYILREKLNSHMGDTYPSEQIIVAFFNEFIKENNPKKQSNISYYNFRILANLIREYEKNILNKEKSNTDKTKNEIERLKRLREEFEDRKAGYYYDREDPENYIKNL